MPNVSLKPDEKMLGHLPNGQKNDLLSWGRSKIPSTQARVWYFHHIGNNPTLHEQYKSEMEHHGSMFGKNNYLKDIKFNKNLDFKQGLAHLQEADSKWQQENDNSNTLITPSKNTVKKIDLGNGWGWYDLNTNECQAESKAMGHCGTGQADSTLLSLRKEVKLGNRVLHQPHVTAELNDGVIVQMKGRKNTKPTPNYHDHIMKLLEHPDVRLHIPSQYKPHLDFQTSDLKLEDREKLKGIKPDLFPFEKGHKVAQKYIDYLTDKQDMSDFGEDDHLLAPYRAHVLLIEPHRPKGR